MPGATTISARSKQKFRENRHSSDCQVKMTPVYCVSVYAHVQPCLPATDTQRLTRKTNFTWKRENYAAPTQGSCNQSTDIHVALSDRHDVGQLRVWVNQCPWKGSLSPAARQQSERRLSTRYRQVRLAGAAGMCASLLSSPNRASTDIGRARVSCLVLAGLSDS